MAPPPPSSSRKFGVGGSIGGASLRPSVVSEESQEVLDITTNIIDYGDYDWLNFPYWEAAIRIDNYPEFLK